MNIRHISDSRVKCVTATSVSGGKGFAPGRWERRVCGGDAARPAKCFPHTFLYSVHYEIRSEDKAWKQKEIPRRKVKQKNKTAW